VKKRIITKLSVTDEEEKANNAVDDLLSDDCFCAIIQYWKIA